MKEMTRVAVAFSNENVSDVRFGKIEKVQIYDLSSEGIFEKEIRAIPHKYDNHIDCQNGCHGKDDVFINNVGELLSDCKYLVIEEIGGYPSRILLRHGIQTLEQGGDVNIILEKLNRFLGK